MRYVFIVFALILSGCTYNVAQQQIGTDRRAPASQAVGITNDGVQAGQTLGAGTGTYAPNSTSQYDYAPNGGYSSSASSFWRGLFEGIVQINIGPGYGSGGGYGYGGGYGSGGYYSGYHPYYRRHYPYYH